MTLFKINSIKLWYIATAHRHSEHEYRFRVIAETEGNNIKVFIVRNISKVFDLRFSQQ
jgi:hypothetical protein